MARSVTLGARSTSSKALGTAVAGTGDEPVLDQLAHRFRQIPEALLVEVGKDALARPGEQLSRDHREPDGAAPLV